MPINVQVRVNDGDIYCTGDPTRMVHHIQNKIRWHSNDIEFEIEFLNGSPFVTGELVLQSVNRWTLEKEVKCPPDEGMDVYVYEVREQNSSGQQLKADPGLIVKP